MTPEEKIVILEANIRKKDNDIAVLTELLRSHPTPPAEHCISSCPCTVAKCPEESRCSWLGKHNAAIRNAMLDKHRTGIALLLEQLLKRSYPNDGRGIIYLQDLEYEFEMYLESLRREVQG